MDLASRDDELRAALFRFVDVVPACRSLDDLARHLAGFLDEVDEHAAADRRRDADGRHARRARALGRRRRRRRAAHGAPLHRRRDPEGGAARRCAGCGSDGVAHLGRPARRGDRHRRRGRPLRRALRRRARRARRDRARPAATAAARARRHGPLPRANLSVKVSALTPLLRPDAPERGKRDAARAPARAAAPRAPSSAPTCTSTWSRSTRARRSPTWCSTLLAEDEFRDGPVAPGIVLQAYLRD